VASRPEAFNIDCCLTYSSPGLFSFLPNFLQSISRPQPVPRHTSATCTQSILAAFIFLKRLQELKEKERAEANMSELQFAKQFLTTLDSKTTKYQTNHVFDPKTFAVRVPVSPYNVLPRAESHANPASSSRSRSCHTLNTHFHQRPHRHPLQHLVPKPRSQRHQ